MLSIADLQRVPVYKAVPEKRATRRDGTPREPERLGKIHFAVFTPGGTSQPEESTKFGHDAVARSSSEVFA